MISSRYLGKAENPVKLPGQVTPTMGNIVNRIKGLGGKPVANRCPMATLAASQAKKSMKSST